MPKKIKKNTLFNEKEQEKNCIDFLYSRGYGIFKLEDLAAREEEEAVKKLRAVGYRVEHIDDIVNKVDVSRISSVDDIVLYFYEMLKRYNRKFDDPEKRKSKDSRAVDRSIINKLLQWRIEDGHVSLREALNEVFLIIDILFDKFEEWSLDIRSTGILSITTNKPLIIGLLKEVRLRQDAALEFEINQIIQQDNRHNYLDILQDARAKMSSVTSGKPPAKKRKVKLGELNGE